MLVKVKKENIEKINELLLTSFAEVPFLFEKNKIYEVDEINNALLIRKFERERNFCIKGLNMIVNEKAFVKLFDYTFILYKKKRRIYFPEELFNIIQN